MAEALSKAQRVKNMTKHLILLMLQKFDGDLFK